MHRGEGRGRVRGKQVALAALGLALLPPVAFADETVVALPTFHPVITYAGEPEADSYAITSETMTLSQKSVTFDMVLSNDTKADIQTLVAIPLPDLNPAHAPGSYPPNPDDENFMNVAATVNGKSVDLEFEQHADVANMDVTADLENAGLSLVQEVEISSDGFGGQDEKTLADWQRRGIVVPSMVDGPPRLFPGWRLRSAAHFDLVLPAGKTVNLVVTSDAVPAANNDFAIDGNGRSVVPSKADIATYCMDDSILKPIAKILNDGNSSGLLEQKLTVRMPDFAPAVKRGDLKVVIDKGDPETLVSFCGEDVKKTGATTYSFNWNGVPFGEDFGVYFLQASQ